MNYSNIPQPQYIPPPVYRAAPNPWNKPIRRNANVAACGLLLVLLLDIFLSPVFDGLESFFEKGLEIKSPQMISLLETSSSLVIYLLMFIIPLTIMRLWIGIPSYVAFPMKTPRASIAFPAVLCCFGVAVIGMFAASATSSFVEAVFRVVPSRYTVPDPIGWSATLVRLFHVTFCAAVLEEFVFRGVIMQSLRRFGDMFALVCSAAMFGLVHHNLEQSIIAFMLGLAIGFFVLRTGSIKTGILIHFVYNGVATAIDYLASDLTGAGADAASIAIVCVYAVAGLIGFALLQVFHGGSFGLAKSAYPVQERKKYSLFFFTPANIIYVIIIVLLICLQLEAV